MVFGDQVGTTSLAFINSAIQPTARPKVFQTLNDAKQAAADPPDRALVPTPDGQFISAPDQGIGVVGQFRVPASISGRVFSQATRWSPASTRRSRR